MQWSMVDLPIGSEDEVLVFLLWVFLTLLTSLAIPKSANFFSFSYFPGHIDLSNQIKWMKNMFWMLKKKKKKKNIGKCMWRIWNCLNKTEESFRKAFITFTKRYKKAVTSNQNTFVTFGKDKEMKNSCQVHIYSFNTSMLL